MGLSFDPDRSIHPILEQHRKQASFKPDKLTNLMYGGSEWTKKKRRMIEVTKDTIKQLGPTSINHLNRLDLYNEGIKQHCMVIKIVQQYPEWNNFEDLIAIMRIILRYCLSGLTVHESMFIDIIENQGTEEQRKHWMNLIKKLQVIGTYVQTELGHGTNVRGLETTATYDKQTEQFVLNTPTLTATKFWPGGLGKTCNYAVVMAQLITDGKTHGVHPFICQLRDIDTHLPLSGVELGDIGTKQGWNGIDNGYLRLDSVRIPRTNMLMKYFVVHKDGRYERIGSNDKAIYSTLIYARSLCASFYGGRMVIMAASVSIRHCLVMKCDKYGSLFENRFVKNTLVTELASGLAIWLAGNALSNEYKRLLPRIMDGDSTPLPALHAISSGYKALSTYLGPDGVERCRRSCGQIGGLVASGLPIISEIISPGVTIDGDNTVMYLQLARYLVKLERKRRENGDSMNERNDDVDYELDVSTANSQSLALYMIKLHSLKSQKLIEQAYDRMTSLVTSEGVPLYEAWNRTSVDLVQAAEAYTISYTVKSFYDVIMSYGNDQDGGPEKDDESLKSVLLDVLCLFAVHSFVSSVNVCYHLLTDKLSTSKLSDLRQSIDKMVDKLAPNALALSDGLDLSDAELDTCIGTYCGNTDADIFNYVAETQPYNAKPDLLKPMLEGLRNYFKLRSRL